MVKHGVTDKQLDREIEQDELAPVAMYFDDVELYLNPLKLNGNEQADVKKDAYVKRNLVAVINCLSIWRDHKPSEATFRALIKILLDLGKEEIATKICQYLKQKVICCTVLLSIHSLYCTVAIIVNMQTSAHVVCSIMYYIMYTVQCHTKSTEYYFCIRTHALLFTGWCTW